MTASGNGGAGFDVSGGRFSCTGCTVANNQREGYFISTPGAEAARIKQGSVANNGLGHTGTGFLDGFHGIHLLQGEIVIDGVSISGNIHGAGVFIDAHATSALMVNNDITGNGRGPDPAESDPGLGGVAIRAGPMYVFTGNKVHANVPDGIKVFRGLGDGTIVLGPAAGCDVADEPPNELYCYGVGNKGLVAYEDVFVTADYNLWHNAPPILGTDFAGAAMFVGTEPGIVIVTTSCAAAAYPCP